MLLLVWPLAGTITGRQLLWSGLTSKRRLPRRLIFIRIGLLLQVVHIIFGAQPEKQVEAGAPLQLVFFFTEKRKVLCVEVLRQWGYFMNGESLAQIRLGIKLRKARATKSR